MNIDSRQILFANFLTAETTVMQNTKLKPVWAKLNKLKISFLYLVNERDKMKRIFHLKFQNIVSVELIGWKIYIVSLS